MGLGDEYSRDALFRRPDQDAHSDSDIEDQEEPPHPEDFEAMYSDEIYTDVVLIQEFVWDGHHRVKNRYGVAEYTRILHGGANEFWSDCIIRMDIMRLWRRLHFREHFDPQSFQNWLEYYIELH